MIASSLQRYEAKLPGKEELDCISSVGRLPDRPKRDFHDDICRRFDVEETIQQSGQSEIA